MTYSKKGTGDMRVIPEADRSSSEVISYKLPPEEIDKIFKDVKPEKPERFYSFEEKKNSREPDPEDMDDEPEGEDAE